ncbi:hypothetical protein [Kitasatospora phosalacinea]|uniref:Lipoprotein n=1 Tax=Kitasatospora phosalacinea TaxID=2065 RepID=A0A9W6PEQ5_9ACTN|nr:hypothetical protein [Kitasatospora phosalacinea]GLW53588.1 hypothetical protein Kpho01_15990 [Kitasatospora phosalacinea]
MNTRTRTRRLAAAAGLLTVALVATGCGPDDSSDTGSGTAPTTAAAATTAAPADAPSDAAADAPSAAPADPSSAASGGATKPAAAAPAGGQAVSPADEAAFEEASMDTAGCAAYYRTHQVLLVTSAAGSQIKGTKVKTECSQYGLLLDTSGPDTTFKVAANASVVMFVKPSGNKTGYPRYTAQKVSFAEYAKTRKPCFDIPEPDGRPAGLQCGPLFIYSADSSGTVTSMHETWEVVD